MYEVNNISTVATPAALAVLRLHTKHIASCHSCSAAYSPAAIAHFVYVCAHTHTYVHTYVCVLK